MRQGISHMRLGEMRFMGDFWFFSPRPISAVRGDIIRARERKSMWHISALLENRGVGLIFLKYLFILHLLELWRSELTSHAMFSMADPCRKCLMILAQVINNFLKGALIFEWPGPIDFSALHYLRLLYNLVVEVIEVLRICQKWNSDWSCAHCNCVHECVTSANKLVKDKSVFSSYKIYNLAFLCVCFQILPCAWTQ